MTQNLNYKSSFLNKITFASLIAVFFLSCIPTFAQAEKKSGRENSYIESKNLTVQPEYPGGIAQFYKVIAKNYIIPKEVTLGGQVIISFIIEKDGSLSHFQTIRDLGSGTGQEAIRVLKDAEKWIPGEVEKKVVRTKFTLPITINISN